METDPWRGLKIGIATYTLRQLPLDATLKTIRRVGLSWASLKDNHLPHQTTAAERQAIVARFRSAGITPLSCGNVGLPTDEAGIRAAFEYARDAGVPTMVCAPHPESLPILDKLVKEFDLRLAIHNHGPDEKFFPTPESVLEQVAPFDARIGLCIDVGHTLRYGVDPARAIRKCRTRVYDIHLKDVTAASAKGAPVEVGRGVLDIPAVLKALRDIRFTGNVGFEYEKDPGDPLAGLAESVGYVRGVLRLMK